MNVMMSNEGNKKIPNFKETVEKDNQNTRNWPTTKNIATTAMVHTWFTDRDGQQLIVIPICLLWYAEDIKEH